MQLVSLVLSLVCVMASEEPALTVTCSAGRVIEGNPAQIHCGFPSGHLQSAEQITVYHIAQSSNRELPVLQCFHWRRDKRACVVNPSYTFDYVTDKELVLSIPTVNSNHGGVYYCEADTQAAPLTPQLCRLDVARKVQPTTTPKTAVFQNRVAKSNQENNGALPVVGEGEKRPDKSRTILLVAAVVVTVLFLLVIVRLRLRCRRMLSVVQRLVSWTTARRQ